jgi:hypothetical protein
MSQWKFQKSEARMPTAANVVQSALSTKVLEVMPCLLEVEVLEVPEVMRRVATLYSGGCGAWAIFAGGVGDDVLLCCSLG